MRTLLGQLKTSIRTRMERWMASRIPPRDEVTLNRRIIYILPTRNGLLYLLAAALIFLGAINYAVSLAFGLAFLMVSLFILAILHGFANLNQLQLSSQPPSPVTQGEEVGFLVVLSRAADRRHESLELTFPEGRTTQADLVDLDRIEVPVYTRANQRGYCKAPRLRVTTYFPLGLCRAWSIVDLNMHCLVYPRPVPFVLQEFSAGGGGSDDSSIVRDGSEDFHGLRDYVLGDSLRQVSWKNLARGQGMQVKEFVDYADERLWLDWDMFFGFNVEERLSRLCYCVQQLFRQGAQFGLKLPGLEIPPASGAEHRRRLLKALALYGSDEDKSSWK